MLHTTDIANRTQKETGTTAILEVGLTPETAAKLQEGMAAIGWQANAFRFNAHLSAERRPSIAPQLRAATHRLCFVDFDTDPEAAATSTKYLRQTFAGEITVIAVGKAISHPKNAALLLQAMRAGCTEFLETPLKPEALQETLSRLESSFAPQPAEERPRGSILSLLGVKGGVGATTAAVHLAMYLVQSCHKKVLLIDNHAELGHVCVYLGIDGSQFPFDEVVRNVSRLDSELLKGYIARHRSGLDVLSSPDTCGAMRPSDPQAMTQTLDFLRGEYDFVLVDSVIGLDAVTMALLQASSQVMLVTTPEVGALRDLTRYLDQFSSIETSDTKIKVVLNRYSVNSPIGLEQIEAAIKRPVSVKLPSSGQELVRSENLGQVLPVDAKLDYTVRVRQWAEETAGVLHSPCNGKPASAVKKPFFAGWKVAGGTRA